MSNTLIERRMCGWLLGGTALCLLVAQALLPVLPSDAAAQVAQVAAHRAAVLGSAAAFLVAGALLILSVAAINTAPVGTARTLTRLGLVLTGVGAIWSVAGRATFNLVIVAIASGPHRAAAVTAAHAIGSSGAFAMLLLTLAAFALGPIVLTVGLWRAGAAPIWPAPLWLVGVLVVNAAATSSRPAAIAGMAIAAAALGWLGHRIANNQATPAQPAAQPATA